MGASGLPQAEPACRRAGRPATTSAAFAATASAVKPYFSITTLSGAEAPKRSSIPTTAPNGPTYFSQPIGTPASTATRARTAAGGRRRGTPAAARRTAPRTGRLTTRAFVPAAGQERARLDGERDLGAGGDQDDVGPALARRRARSRPSRRRRSPARTGTACRVEQERGRARAASSPRATRRPSRWRRRGGSRRGAGSPAARPRARSGWWVGPSSPTPMLSWVKT